MIKSASKKTSIPSRKLMEKAVHCKDFSLFIEAKPVKNNVRSKC
jgi:hypothetical protein